MSTQAHSLGSQMEDYIVKNYIRILVLLPFLFHSLQAMEERESSFLEFPPRSVEEHQKALYQLLLNSYNQGREQDPASTSFDVSKFSPAESADYKNTVNRLMQDSFDQGAFERDATIILMNMATTLPPGHLSPLREVSTEQNGEENNSEVDTDTSIEEQFLEAAYNSNLAKVKRCVALGVNINLIHINSQESALHIAAWNNDANLVRYLLENRANVQQQSKKGYTPLALAEWAKNRTIIPLLQEAQRGTTSLNHSRMTRAMALQATKKASKNFTSKPNGAVQKKRRR